MELKLNTRSAIPTVPVAAVAEQEEMPRALTPAEQRQQAREDKIELSKQAIEFVQSQTVQPQETAKEAEVKPLTPAEQRAKTKSIQRQAARQMLDTLILQSQQMKKQSDPQTEALNKALDQMKKCSKIASRIQKGGRIPPEDEKYLLEHDPKLYMMAMMMRMMEQNKEDKRYDSVLDEEDLKGQDSSADTDSAEAPTVDGAAQVSAE